MGIKNLHSFLRSQCPEIYKTVHLSEFSYQKIAIDISLYMFKYKTIFGDKWLDAFIKLIACLRKNEIHCVFIYDNGAPPEKMSEREERANKKQKLIDKIKNISDNIESFFQTGEPTELLMEIYSKHQPTKLTRLLTPARNEKIFDVSVVEQYLEKVKKQVVNIDYSDFPLTKQLFDIIGVPYFNAILEAETTCSHLCLSGVVDGVLSEDTDVLAYGTPLFLTKINTSAETCVIVKIKDILESLELTYLQFKDLCIMSGCDYNKNIPRVGSQTSYKLLTEHGSIDNLPEKFDISILNHKRSRELFTLDNQLKWEIPFCKEPDWNELKLFIFKNNSRINIEYLEKCFQPREIIFESSEEEFIKELFSGEDSSDENSDENSDEEK
jgi:5'-3' exonuclease